MRKLFHRHEQEHFFYAEMRKKVAFFVFCLLKFTVDQKEDGAPRKISSLIYTR
jgi:hypothetical protein